MLLERAYTDHRSGSRQNYQLERVPVQPRIPGQRLPVGGQASMQALLSKLWEKMTLAKKCLKQVRGFGGMVTVASIVDSM
jgi:hypothetical protein